jgi:hypothetical protein
MQRGVVVIVNVVDGEDYPWLLMRYGRPNDENLAAFMQRYLKAGRTRAFLQVLMI